ncbi:cbb3-type cytochrome oxidase assembly protein CcoS [Halomonas denitrificans]|uniref:cbb3-type cytochrome oxidase assembly protein CcoS n=1 Tax=Halomonas denitrificans TaxID=370769 RepID=UPI001472F2AD|nr:cbb3-type cytochrome oxidase assembly protein CcoS [Halomonas denitrificans]
MNILYLLIPLSLILLGLAVWAFFWAVRHDQFEDLEGPAYRILFDEDENDRPRQPRDSSSADPDAGAPRDEDRRDDGRRD